ncbi:MAG: hypothetical protein H7Y89_15450 [Steroidobacteraceae bacterium]|nr:hypothetical protein [Steroidobacteraceae bacterium]
MRRFWPLLAVLAMPIAATADDLRVVQLEQEVRRLERQVLALSRRLDEVQRPSFTQERPMNPAAAAPTTGGEWIDAAKWKRVKPGMTELEVIALLGVPTSMREEADGRVLLYALELGASGFLGGSVTLRDRKVTRVDTPVLR